ncbi:hypothetical protein H2201_005994 [Coniosporium apollinis]|uniref:Dolichyldiphosphatase n=1 Tax=Coniosporium apollinis TaxID=61459 RepID=A0ABQ9NNE7_9PEZI|nr:hypothetical protein H2201_005994 [Coniosporium apollinis]
MEDPPLASLSLTHVNYNPDDRLSYLCAWLALVPQGLCITYATLVWSTREVEVLLMFTGQLACEALNWCLKRYIKEERPRREIPGTGHFCASFIHSATTNRYICGTEMNGKGYGMPSSHAQFVAFFSVTLVLFLLFRHLPHPTQTHTPITFIERALLALISILGAGAVAWSRIYLNYHTPQQVLVGCAAGAGFAGVWFAFTSYLRKAEWIDWALDMAPARALRFRDLVVQEDLVDAGWARWDSQRKKRLLKPEKDR